MTFIGEYAFSKCCLLREMNIPNGVTGICDCLFYECESLKKVNIPGGVKSIGMYAFAYCHSLEELVIPDSVKTIGVNAFLECGSLTVTAPHEPEYYSLSSEELAEQIESWVVNTPSEGS